MANFTFEIADFRTCCEHFLLLSQRLSDDWVKIYHDSSQQNGFYLRKKKACVSKVSSTNNISQSLEEQFEVEDQTFEDPSSISSNFIADVVNWEYHIIYSQSYNVPVLYFNCWRCDGSLLSLEEILNLSSSSIQPQVKANRWQTISQQEHPFLGTPFYQLHPCRTAELLSIIQENSKINPLVSWLSTFGPAVGLMLKIEYGTAEYPAQSTVSADI